MIALFVHIIVKPKHVEAFLAATAKNHEGSLAEPGCHRFDVLRDAAEPNRFYLYEVYEDEAALDAHRGTAHYAAWSEAVAPLMLAPRSREKAQILLPEDPA